jgi:hypothetical protein
VVGSNAKYPRKNSIAQSSVAIRTNKIEKKQDLFVSRIQAVPLGCAQDGMDILARQSGLLKSMLNELLWSCGDLRRHRRERNIPNESLLT